MEKNPIEMYDLMKSGKIKLAKEEDKKETVESTEKDEVPTSGKAIDMFNKYLALLRVSAIVHQHSHWKCKGNNFYSNHKLFSDLYSKSLDRVDEAAEKLIGIFGNSSLDHAKQLPLMVDLCKYHTDDYINNSLEVECAFSSFAEDMYNRLKETGDMTLGLDDMIMSHINESELAQYLLKQSV